MAKKDFQYGGRPPFWILNIFIFGQWLSSSSKAAVVYHISQKSDNFVADIMATMWNFWNLKFVTWPLLLCYSASLCAKFHWNWAIGCRVMAKIFSIWRPSAILNSNFFTFGHVTVIEFQIWCCAPNLIKIGWFLVKIWRLNDFQDGRCLPSWTIGVQEWVLWKVHVKLLVGCQPTPLL